MPVTYPAYGDTPQQVLYVGAVLDMGEMNYHDDSDFYAVVWDSKRVKRVEYDTTRFPGGGSCSVDATPETIAAAAAWLRCRLYKMWREADMADARRAKVGRKVRIVKGRPTQKLADGTKEKVALGTEGTVFHTEERRSQYGTWSYGYRVGIALTDRRAPGYTLTENEAEGTLTLKAPYSESFPRKARALDGDWDKTNRVWTFPASRKAEVVALADEFFPGTYLDVCWTKEDNVEVMDPVQYEAGKERGKKWASEHNQCWRAYTHPRGSGMLFA